MEIAISLALFLAAWTNSIVADERFDFLYAGALFAGETYVSGTVGGVAAGDVDGDGHIDVVTSHGHGYPLCTLTVLRGRGDGSLFEHAVQRLELLYFPGPFGPRLTLGDLDSDGHLDLALTGSLAPASISVLLGNGLGSFGPPVEHPAGSEPAHVRIADMDGDGRQDLVLGLRDSLGISVLLGDGGGGFSLRQALTVGSDFFGPNDIEVADVTGDGRPDVIAALPKGLLVFLRNAGDGSLLRPVRIPLGVPATALALSDFDLDGLPDLACGIQGGVVFLSGLGGGAFEQRGGVHLIKGEAVTSLDAVRLGSADMPGLCATIGVYPELFALIHVETNLSGGEVRLQPLNALWCRLTAADLDEDGFPEIVARAGSGSWLPEPAIVFPSGADGWIRGVVSSAVPPYPPNWSTSRRLTLLEDLDGDRIPEAVLDGPFNVCVMKGNATGAFTDPFIQPCSALATTDPVVGDFDGDGAKDLASGRSLGYAMGPTPYVYLVEPSVELLFGQGDGTFGGVARASLARRALGPPQIRSVDLDGNGTDELAAYDAAEGRLQVLGLDATGALAVLAESSVPTRGKLLDSRDVDGDGRQEILLVLGGTRTSRAIWSVAWNASAGLTRPKELHPLPQDDELALQVSDWNHDGLLDVAVGTGTLSPYIVYTDGTFSSWEGLDGNDFEPTGYVRTRGATYPYPATDLDGDGREELCARLEFAVGAAVGVWAREVGPGLRSLGQYAAAQLATRLGDMNGDGLADMVYTVHDRIFTSFNLAAGHR